MACACILIYGACDADTGLNMNADDGHRGAADGLGGPTPVSTRQALQLVWRVPTAHAGPQKAAHGVAVAATLPHSVPTALPGLAGPSRPPALSTGLVASTLMREGHTWCICDGHWNQMCGGRAGPGEFHVHRDSVGRLSLDGSERFGLK